MVVRNIETCPKCGKVNPWRVYSTRVVRGERRKYCVCKSCGAKETVVYRLKSAIGA